MLVWFSAAHAQTVTNDRTGAVFPTLADAVAAALADDVLVVDGTLAEGAIVDRSLTLLGAPGATIEAAAPILLEVSAGVDLTVDGLALVGVGDAQGLVAVGGGNTLFVSNTTFSTGTTAIDVNGGGMEILDPVFVQLDDVSFLGAAGRVWGEQGGALYVNAAAEVPVLLNRVTFDHVEGTNNGGAIYAANVDLQVADSVFTAVVGGFGGAIYATGGHLTVQRSTFCGGEGSLGGSLFSDAIVELRNNVFAEGTTFAARAGAVYANGGVWTIENNTFVGVGGASVVFVSILSDLERLANNLFLSCPGTKAVDATLAAGTPVQYNWFHDNGGTHNGFVLDGTNVTAGGDPGLSAWSADGECANDELWPALGSPLVDAGDPAVADLDGSRSDIGASGGPSADSYVFTDHDHDGTIYLYDCDDANDLVFPDGDEWCDGLDNDCDGVVDDSPVDLDTFYPDCDGDLQGGSVDAVIACDEPVELPACGGAWRSLRDLGLLAYLDCDDADPTVYFGAPERCAAGDQSCDGDDDAGAIDAPTWYLDDDGDGWGDLPVAACAAPAGAVAVGGDCAPDDGAVYPGAVDPCGDGVDADCSGADGVAGDGVAWYPDVDGDGFGDAAAAAVVDCRPGGGFGGVGDATDCDDGAAAVHPGATESCDGIDQDCDGTADDTGDAVTFYLDADGDGYGTDASEAVADCPPEGAVLVGGDCDDADDAVNPAAVETCDGQDEDCDEAVDEGACPAGSEEPDPEPEPGTCGCASGPSSGWLALGGAALFARRARRRARPGPAPE